MNPQVVVRPARAEDRGAVLAFCQNTFSWGDYIAEVWDRWLADTDGQMLVGSVAEQPVGIVHIATVNGTAWMEGMRVNPDFRRRGIGSALDAQARSFSREKGCRAARLVTSVNNNAAQQLLAKIGYCRVAAFVEWEAVPVQGDSRFVRVATKADLPVILTCWEDSQFSVASHAVVPDRRWRWTELTPARVREQMARGEVRVAGGSFALLLGFDEPDWNGLGLHALVGDEEMLFTFALAARGEAEYRGYPRLEAILVDHAVLNAAMERAGYRREGGMLLYEQEL